MIIKEINDKVNEARWILIFLKGFKYKVKPTSMKQVLNQLNKKWIEKSSLIKDNWNKF